MDFQVATGADWTGMYDRTSILRYMCGAENEQRLLELSILIRTLTRDSTTQSTINFSNLPIQAFHTPSALTGITRSLIIELFRTVRQKVFPYLETLAHSSEAQTPNCPQGIMQWQHGSYTKNPNGSLSLEPIAVDGRQLLSDPCKYKYSVFTRYHQPEYIKVGYT